MAVGYGGGFGDISGDASPFPRGRGSSGSSSVGPLSTPMSSGPNAAPVSSPAPASQLPYGQAKDPGAYGTPGADSSSPLGMWQTWLNTMGPYLAQLPGNQPQAESGGLSSLSPSSTGQGLAGYGGGWDSDWRGNGRGFRAMMM